MADVGETKLLAIRRIINAAVQPGNELKDAVETINLVQKNTDPNSIIARLKISPEELAKIIKSHSDFVSLPLNEQEKIYCDYSESLENKTLVEPTFDAGAQALQDSSVDALEVEKNSRFEKLSDKFLTEDQKKEILSEIFEHNPNINDKKWNKLSSDKRAAIFAQQLMETSVRKQYNIDEKTWHSKAFDEKKGEYISSYIDSMVYGSPGSDGKILGKEAWNKLTEPEKDAYRAEQIQRLADENFAGDTSMLPEYMQNTLKYYNFRRVTFDTNGNNIHNREKGFEDLTTFLLKDEPRSRINNDKDQELLLSQYVRKMCKSNELTEEELKNLYMRVASTAKDTHELNIVNKVFQTLNKDTVNAVYSAVSETQDTQMKEQAYIAGGNINVEEAPVEVLVANNSGLTNAAENGNVVAGKSLGKLASNVVSMTGSEKAEVAGSLVRNASVYCGADWRNEFSSTISDAKNVNVMTSITGVVLDEKGNFSTDNQVLVASSVPPKLRGDNLKKVAELVIKLDKQPVTEAAASVASEINGPDQVNYHDIFWKTDNESVQNILTNQIGDYAKENQKVIYERTMTSKYDSVLENAASNIYKLDESVRGYAEQVTRDLGKENVTSSIRTEAPPSNSQVGTKAESNSYTSDNSVTKPISAVNLLQTATQSNLTFDNLSDYAKKVYTKADLYNGNMSKDEAVKMFETLSRTEKSNLLRSLSPQQFDKLPIEVCESFPELIQVFIDKGKGVQIISSCSASTADIAIRKMKTGSNEIRKTLNEFIVNNPVRFTEISQECATLALKGNKKEDDVEQNKPAKKPFTRIT